MKLTAAMSINNGVLLLTNKVVFLNNSQGEKNNISNNFRVLMQKLSIAANRKKIENSMWKKILLEKFSGC